MSSFLYFFPDLPTLVTRRDFELRELGHALPPAGGPTSSRIDNGPGGTGGVLTTFVGAGGKEPTLRFDSDNQDWRRGPGRWIEGKELVSHVGASRGEQRPTPATLARERFVAGETVRLRDGNDWTIPIARSVVRGSTLPKELVVGEDLKSWSSRDLPEYLSLCADAERVFTWLHGGEPDAEGNVVVSIPYSEGMRIAVAALAVNYRVGPAEVDLLRLFSEPEMEAVLKAVCDFPAYEQMLQDRKKKNRPPLPDLRPLARRPAAGLRPDVRRPGDVRVRRVSAGGARRDRRRAHAHRETRVKVGCQRADNPRSCWPCPT